MSGPQEVLARIVESRLGAPGPAEALPPASPPEAGAAPPPGAPQEVPPSAKPPPVPPTVVEKAEAAGSPEDEGDRMSAPPMMYEVPFGEEKLQLTPEQIRGTFDRYGALNLKHSQLKPFVELGEELMKRVPEGTDASVVAQAMIKALTHNAQMGQAGNPQMAGQPETPPEGNADLSAQLETCEKENAVALPPGYKDMMGLTSQVSTMRQMLEQVLGHSTGVAQAARQAREETDSRAVNVQRQHIMNNFGRVAQELQMPDEAAQDFMVFATERGYTVADFADYGLLRNVVSDYKANAQSPEVERLREIHKRRQAFVGTTGSSPAGGEPAAPAPGADRLKGMTEFALKRRGMM